MKEIWVGQVGDKQVHITMDERYDKNLKIDVPCIKIHAIVGDNILDGGAISKSDGAGFSEDEIQDFIKFAKNKMN